MPACTTLTEAMKILADKGYNYDFNLANDCIECKEQELRLHPEEFTIDEVYRFEGDSNPDDESVLYAISSEKYNIKGILINAYGLYNDALASDLVAKLTVHHDNERT